MESTEFLSILVDIHNNLAEISVRGDDTIRMADIIKKCRSAVFSLQEELSKGNKEKSN